MKKINLKTKSPKILIIKLKHIGDVLMATPVISALRDRMPDSHISMLVRKGTEEMITGNPKINEVIVYGGFKDKALPLRILKEIDFALGLRKKRYDLIIELGFGDREAIYGFISGARYRIGFDPKGEGFPGRCYSLTHRIPMDNSKHVVERDMDIIGPLGMVNGKKELELYYLSEDKKFIEGLLREKGIKDDDLIVLIHPTSRWLFKCWTDSGNAAVADYIQGRYKAKVIITCGPGKKEIDKTKRIIGMMKSRAVCLLGNLRLEQLAALIDRADLFFGIDSAPMHMAAALKTPVIALFGPSGEHNWAPWGKGNTVIKKDMECRPCGKAGCNDSKKSKCLEEITLEDVIPYINDNIMKIKGGMSSYENT